MSSAGVLGAASPPDGFHDGSIACPHDPYTASKLEAEACLNVELEAGCRLAIVRPPLIYGTGAKGNLMRLLRLALSGWPLPLGSLRAPRSMIGVRNVVDLLALTATDARLTRATLLIADRETLSVSELYGAIARHAGHRLWLAPLPPALVIALLTLTGRAHDVARLTAPFVLRPTEAYRRFGWLPPHSLADELKTTVEQELTLRAHVKK
jgi:nucleoside-diphosphate-sugar epimerase